MPEQKKVYLLSQEEISDLVKQCTQSGVEAYQKQEQDARRRNARNNDRAWRMKEKLSSYRRVKKTLKEEQQYTPREKYEYRLKFLEDLMGDPVKNKDRTERMLLDREEKHRQDYYSIHQIEAAMELYLQECQESGNEEDMRRYRAMKMFYINSTAMTVKEIAALENVSEKTVYRDINIACDIMYQYVIGM